MTDIPRRTRLALWIQREVGRVLSVFWIPASAFALRYVMRYRIQDAARLRKRFRALVRESDEPILICANHLTMVDSMLVAWALGGSWWYFFNYRRMPWNLPEHRNFASVWFGKAAVWITKCIPIKRGGRREEVSGALKRVKYLLSKGETALIFAEGGRSRTGRIQLDSIAHGMGRIASSVRNCRALVVYLRGDRQRSWSTVPAVGDSFYVDFELVRPHSERTGMRRSREYAQQIADRLVRMEEKYFARRK
ncbi:MAG: 1-acyl-sn-glycerol-3-phosphate acyltransferase [Candidatus Palauibacterales bacterium]|nr:1-acyl-sn-glycerol-3-phosphate acyltransferase [Candidatus Palauibacterales bacterium]